MEDGKMQSSPDELKKLTEIRLIPEPSSSSLDPLNWPTKRKAYLLGTLALASFATDGAAPANLLAYNQQALAYHKEPIQVAYGTSASLAGFFLGPWLYPVFFQMFGKSAMVFWGVLLQILVQVWGALMTGPDDFIGYIMSRLLSGSLATIPFAAGSAVIMEVFFLHQRGRMFAVLELSFVFGVFVVPSIGGFVIQNKSLGWPWCFWWTAILLGGIEILVFIFMEETTFDRDSVDLGCNNIETSFIQKRIDRFLLPRRRCARPADQKPWRQLLIPLKIVVDPNIIVVGTFNMVCFGFATLAGVLVNIYLQTPVERGGYGFSPQQNAYFSFTSWVAIAFGFFYACVTGDRVPIRFACRRGGYWCPEYRLLNLILPGLLLPIGFGIFGASLKYRTHYILVAFGLFLIQFSAQIGVPICINYAVENHVKNPLETTIAMNALRLPLSIALPFVATPCLKALGIDWCFGMAAILSLGMFGLVVVVAWYSSKRRMASRPFRTLSLSEAGQVIVETNNSVRSTT